MAKRKFTKEQFEKALEDSFTIREVLGKLNIPKKGSNYEQFHRAAKTFKIDVSNFTTDKADEKIKRKNISNDLIINAVKNNQSYSSLLKELDLKTGINSNNRWLKKKINELKLDISHFTGQAHLKGKTHSYTKATPLKEVLVENSTYSRVKLKERLIKEKILIEECSECKLGPEWNGKKLVLHIDHINGVWNDNRIHNLRLLCPNCHSQTDNYCGKNKKKHKEKQEILCLSCSVILREKRKTGLCIKCVKKVEYNSTTNSKSLCQCGQIKNKNSNVCKICHKTNVETKINWPTKDELQQLLWLKPTQQIAKDLGVSDKAVEKKAKSYGCTKPPRGYWAKKATEQNTNT